MATKIYIDQGHNPVNPNAGAEGNGLREQDIVYRIGVELAEIFKQNGYETRLSRPTPTTQLGDGTTASSLAARVNDANSWGADYFISLHTDASLVPTVSGMEGFAYSKPSTAYTMGEYILDELSLETGLQNRGMFTRPGLYVLKKTAMPAVLLELGFITNAEDAYLLSQNPKLFALGIYNGFNNFISR